MDRFPEAFHRFERVVDLRSFRSGRDLKYAFSHWAGRRWVNSYYQNKALNREIEKRVLGTPRPKRYSKRPQFYSKQTWKQETVNVRGKAQIRYRDIKTGRFIKKP
jgi:hypothetical protein